MYKLDLSEVRKKRHNGRMPGMKSARTTWGSSPMPDNMMGRILSEYAREEPWKRDHDDAMDCYEIEQVLSIGIHLFRFLVEFETFVIANGGKSSDRTVEQQLADCTLRMRSWITASERYAEATSQLATKGYEIKRLEEFRLVLEEAVCIVENSELESEMLPIDELMRRAKPENPDPARYGN